MEEYLDEMLHLTADIAEELLTIKDTGSPLSDHTAEMIARLAELAVTYRMEEPDGDIPAAPAPVAGGISVGDAQWQVEEEISEALATEAEEHEEAFEVAPVAAAQAEEVDEEAEAENAEAEEAADADVAVPTLPEPEPIAEPEPEPEPEPEQEPEPEPEPEPQRMPLFTARDLRNAFTLNDVFLFQRVLFHGSPSEFKNALEEITTLASADELREYLQSQHHINLKSDEARDFVGIVSSFFK